MNVCPHCKRPYDNPEVIDVCAQCEGENVGEKSTGDEGFTVCEDCNSIEGGYKQARCCPNCEQVMEVSKGREF